MQEVTKDMIKVVILAYDFPPYVSVGGLRPYSWYKYLKNHNIYPVVITRQWNNMHGGILDYVSPSESYKTQVEITEFGTIVKASYRPNLSNKLLLKYGESRYKIIRKIITAFFEFGQYLFLIGPKSSLYFAAKNYLNANNADILVATGVPFVLFKYAHKLSKNNNIPWIADYRDPWSFNKNRNGNYMFQMWNAFFEKKYIKSAHSIVTVSSFLQKNIVQFVSDKSFCVIPNGYDPEAIESANEIQQRNDLLSIIFVGTIYKWHPVESFLSVCNDFITKNIEARFQLGFYGINDEIRIMNILKSYPNLVPHIIIYPKFSNVQLLQKIASENVFLLFNHYSYMGTKIYDYIALKRKILFCYSDDCNANMLKRKYFKIDESNSENTHLQADLLNKTNSGIIVRDAAHLQIVLQDLYAEFKLKGSIECKPIATEHLSRKIQVQKFAEIIHGIIDSKEK
jgi:glycosyltransferase involved in cell wall biosynthesis